MVSFLNNSIRTSEPACLVQIWRGILMATKEVMGDSREMKWPQAESYPIKIGVEGACLQTPRGHASYTSYWPFVQDSFSFMVIASWCYNNSIISVLLIIRLFMRASFAFALSLYAH